MIFENGGKKVKTYVFANSGAEHRFCETMKPLFIVVADSFEEIASLIGAKIESQHYGKDRQGRNDILRALFVIPKSAFQEQATDDEINNHYLEPGSLKLCLGESKYPLFLKRGQSELRIAAWEMPSISFS